MRYSKVSKVIGFNIGMIGMILALAEVFLRLIGFQPGVTETYIREVDSLVVHPEYIGDEYGIQKLSSSARDTAIKYINLKKGELDFAKLESSEMETTLKELITDFHFVAEAYKIDEIAQSEVREGLTNSEFYDYISKLRKRKKLKPEEQAIMVYTKAPINTDGFRSIPFHDYDTDKVKVLLLGDSFTWGRSARPIFNSFPDILLARGYLVFNTGIVCADPAQYTAIAERYIPKLKPDIVIVNYYLGNDNMYAKRKLQPHMPIFYFTNAGIIQSNPLGFYMTAEAAYQHILSGIRIPVHHSIFNKCCATLVVTTLLWKMLNKMDVVHFKVKKYSVKPVVESKEPISETYIDRINSVCDSNHAKMLLAVIPDMVFEHFPLDSLNRVFTHNKYYYPANLTLDDYVGSGDDHFNNSGMKKYADFLEVRIDSLATTHY